MSYSKVVGFLKKCTYFYLRTQNRNYKLFNLTSWHYESNEIYFSIPLSCSWQKSRESFKRKHLFFIVIHLHKYASDLLSLRYCPYQLLTMFFWGRMYGYFFEYHFSGQHLFYRLGVKISYWLNAWLKIELTWLVINKLRFAFNKSGSFHYSVFFFNCLLWLEITAGWILFFEQLVIIQESMQISLCINQGL